MKQVLKLVLGIIIYYLTAIYGMAIFSFQPSNITILWLPFAIGVVLVHHFGVKAVPLIFLASFFANVSGMNNGIVSLTVFHTIISSFADSIAPLISATLLKKYVDEKFNSIKGFLPFTLYGVIIPTFVSSMIISLNLYWGDYILYENIPTYIVLLIFADGLGLFLIYPIYKNFSTTLFNKSDLQQLVFYSLIIFAFVYLSFYFHFVIFIFSTLIVIMAFRVREDIVAITLLLSIMQLIALCANNQNIFQGNTQHESILMLMAFISSLVFIVLGITQHQKDLIKHQYLSITDVLTQTQNRFSYKETIENYINEFNRKKIPFSMLLFDIDNFKSINDTYGHLVGDKVLADLSSLIQNNIRSSDALFRIGGEEFAVLFPNTELKKAVKIAEKLRKLVESNLKTIENKTITVSMGISKIKEDDTEDSIYRRVDNLMYLSKKSGKNKINFN